MTVGIGVTTGMAMTAVMTDMTVIMGMVGTVTEGVMVGGPGPDHVTAMTAMTAMTAGIRGVVTEGTITGGRMITDGMITTGERTITIGETEIGVVTDIELSEWKGQSDAVHRG